jgi:LVIVD repeat-containing protein
VRFAPHSLSLIATLALAGCASSTLDMSTTAPAPDRRVGLRAGTTTAAEAFWNLHLVSTTPASEKFAGVTNSDLSFSGKYAIQGNYNGFQVWDISTPAKPQLKIGYLCPASQSDVSIYKNLLFVSGEGTSGRLDCGAQGVHDSVSHDRLRGLRIFDVTDIAAPKYVGNVQTCRGSHTHTVVEDPNDKANVYVYISGSAGVRSPTELPGCSRLAPDSDANSALFRIEVIQVPLAHPEQAHLVSSPRIFNDLIEAPTHAEAAIDIAAAARSADSARAKGAFTATIRGMQAIAPSGFVKPLLDSIVKARQGTGDPTAADSAALRSAFQGIVDNMINRPPPGTRNGIRPGPNQCHDITVYPAIGLAGGACGGYGLLLDIHDPANPKRIAAVADSNFSYWHSATFNNDGTKLLFSDEWGGGGQPKCRSTDKPEWGADAIFTVNNGALQFQSYYKMPAPQTPFENCVAHNGSLIPIPGRDVMVQAWYQGGISVFDWTDPAHPREIAYFDRGPMDSTKMVGAGSWSAYWYNGVIVSSEIARGLDILELQPSGFISQNEIDAAKLVHLDYLNVQGQPKLVWPASFVVARAYVDQLARSGGLTPEKVAATRTALAHAEKLSGQQRKEALTQLAGQLTGDAAASSDGAKVRTLAAELTELAGAGQ